jgi:hypothetical protein
MREKKYLLLTLSIIFLVGTPALFSMIQEPSAKRDIASSSSGRSPASVEKKNPVSSEPTGRNQIKAKSVTMDYHCEKAEAEDSSYEEETDGNLLRLKSDACLSDKWKNVSIVNQTNGFTASVIFLKQGFTTDFIELAEGDNKLAVQGIDQNGQVFEQVLNIKRRAPASL